MKKAIRYLIPVLLVAAVVLGIFLYNRITAIVPGNTADTIGNSAGNLLSGGAFCESDGTIFFSNPYDNGRLYSMNPDCSDIRYVSPDSAGYINAAGKYLYYVRTNASQSLNAASLLDSELYGVVRCMRDGSRKSTLHVGYSTDLSLSGNTLVFNANRNNTNVTYTVSIKGNGSSVLNDYDVNNSCVITGEIIYSGSDDDNSVYAMNMSDGSYRMVYTGNTAMASVVDDYLYYIDLDNDDRLTCVDLLTDRVYVLTAEPVTLYNVYDGMVFYQTAGDKPALCKINRDGSDPYTVVEGTVTSIYCTSIYTFFQFEGADSLYRIETYNTGGVQTFFIETV